MFSHEMINVSTNDAKDLICIVVDQKSINDECNILDDLKKTGYHVVSTCLDDLKAVVQTIDKKNDDNSDIQNNGIDFNKDKILRAVDGGKKFELDNESILDEQKSLSKGELVTPCGSLLQFNTIVDNDQNWNESITHPNFDENFFRLDILGNLVIKDDCFYGINKNSDVKKFDYTIYSGGDQSQVYNGGLLNDQIKRSLGNNDLYSIDKDKLKQYCNEYGVNPEEFLYNLENDLDYTNEKYELEFRKCSNGKWRVYPIINDSLLLSPLLKIIKNYSLDDIKKYFSSIGIYDCLVVLCLSTSGVIIGTCFAYKYHNFIKKEDTTTVTLIINNISIDIYKKIIDTAFIEFENTKTLENLILLSENMIYLNATLILKELNNVDQKNIEFMLLDEHKKDLDYLKTKYTYLIEITIDSPISSFANNNTDSSRETRVCDVIKPMDSDDHIEIINTENKFTNNEILLMICSGIPCLILGFGLGVNLGIHAGIFIGTNVVTPLMPIALGIIIIDVTMDIIKKLNE